MNKETVIGVISRVHFGFGGYQDGMFGLNLTFDFKSTGCQTFISGGWNFDPSESASWTKEDKANHQSKMCDRVISIMKDAKVDDVTKLVGKPVQCEFSGPCGELKDWRILTEAIL